MEPKVVDATSKLSRHIIVGLLSFVLVYLFLRSGLETKRAFSLSAFILLFLVMVIGPAMRLYRPLVRMFPWQIPWGWRGELGVWFVLLAVGHAAFIYYERKWSLALLDAGDFLGLVALFWGLALAATSFARAIRFLGMENWKWLHGFSYVIFYFAATHILYRSFLNPGLPLGRPQWFYLAMTVAVVVLQIAAFIKNVIDYKKSTKVEVS